MLCSEHCTAVTTSIPTSFTVISTNSWRSSTFIIDDFCRVQPVRVCDCAWRECSVIRALSIHCRPCHSKPSSTTSYRSIFTELFSSSLHSGLVPRTYTTYGISDTVVRIWTYTIGRHQLRSQLHTAGLQHTPAPIWCGAVSSRPHFCCTPTNLQHVVVNDF